MPAAPCAATQRPRAAVRPTTPWHAPSLRHPWHDQPRIYHFVAPQHDLAGSNSASLAKPALPSFGTWAFEAHLELLTLERMRLDVEGIKAQLQAGAQVIEDGKPIEIEAVDAKLYDVAKQFEAYQAHLSNLAQGRGMIETQAGRVRTTVEEQLIVPVSPQDLATFAQRELDGAAAMAEERAKATQSKIGAAPSDAAANRRALVATALGEKARYAARVGPDSGHPTFGKPWSA